MFRTLLFPLTFVSFLLITVPTSINEKSNSADRFIPKINKFYLVYCEDNSEINIHMKIVVEMCSGPLMDNFTLYHALVKSGAMTVIN